MRRLAFLALLALSAFSMPSAAQAQNVACTPFSGFPLDIKLGYAPAGVGGEDVRCANQKTMDAVNALNTQLAPGVSCSAGTVNPSTLTVTNGVVTHC